MNLIRLLPVEPKINFMKMRSAYLFISGFLLLGSIISVLTLGLNFGVDFRGGILMEVRMQEAPNLSEMRQEVSALGIGEVSLQEFGSPNDILINIQRQEGDEAAQNSAIQMVKETIGDRVAEYRRIEFVGPKVGGELRRDGIIATILALLGIAVYIWFRFEWHFSLAALLSLMHDIIATIGFFSITQIEFNLPTLAAVLTVAGYSINDTVVVFDRVREMLRKYKTLSLFELSNKALNGTLTRTLLTSITTLLALLALLIFGGEVIFGLAAGLIFGLFIGTYSSIGVAVPLLGFLGLEHVRADEQPVKANP